MCQDVGYVEQNFVQVFAGVDGFIEGHVDDIVVNKSDHDASLVVHQGIDGSYAEAAGQEPVEC